MTVGESGGTFPIFRLEVFSCVGAVSLDGWWRDVYRMISRYFSRARLVRQDLNLKNPDYALNLDFGSCCNW